MKQSSTNQEAPIAPSSVGEYIKEARLRKNIEIQKIAERTKISLSFIKAIEQNDFSKFPSAIYVIGFVTNICEVIGVDPTVAVQLFREKHDSHNDFTEKKTENENDNLTDNYLRKRREQMMKPIFYSGLVLIIALIIAIVIIKAFSSGQKKIINATDNQVVNVRPYTMFDTSASYDLKVGGIVNVLYNEEKHVFKVISITSDTVECSLGKETWFFSLGGSRSIDINGDAVPDIQTTLKKISGGIAIIQIDLLNSSVSQIDYRKIWDTQSRLDVDKETILFNNQDRHSIVVYIQALTQPSYITYNIDGKRQNTTTLQTGTSTILTAEEHIEISIGNYRSAALIVNKIPINLTSNRGNISITKIIKWVSSPENELKNNMIIKDHLN